MQQQNLDLWKQATPNCISKKLSDITSNIEYNLVNGITRISINDNYLEKIIDEFSKESLSIETQVLELLHSYGCTNSYFGVTPIHETIAEEILSLYDFEILFKTYKNSTKSINTTLGIGRFLCCHNFLSQRKKYLNLIDQNTIEEIEFTFKHFSGLEVLKVINDLKKEWIEVNH